MSQSINHSLLLHHAVTTIPQRAQTQLWGQCCTTAETESGRDEEGGMEALEGEVTGGVVLLSGEKHSKSQRKKKKIKNKIREGDAASIRLSARGISN